MLYDCDTVELANMNRMLFRPEQLNFLAYVRACFHLLSVFKSIVSCFLDYS
jgi:hypothetical protein